VREVDKSFLVARLAGMPQAELETLLVIGMLEVLMGLEKLSSQAEERIHLVLALKKFAAKTAILKGKTID
jgi:hypothetical protein